MASSVSTAGTSPVAVSRRLTTVAATAAIAAAILTGAGVAGWILAIAYNGFTALSSDGAGDDGRFISVATTIGAAVFGALAVAVVAMVFVRQVRPRALHGRALVPTPLHRRLRRIHELSVFGVGAMDTWTAHNPAVALSDIRQPASPAWLAGLIGGADDQARSVSPSGTSSHNGGPLTMATPAAGGHHRASFEPGSQLGDLTEHRGRSSSVATEHRGPIGRHVVTRGDTLWTLAERHLGDGARWTELRDLNIGREVAPGVVFEPGTSLRSGWDLAIPAPAGT